MAFMRIQKRNIVKPTYIGVLGPACSNTVEALAGVSKHYRTVVVTYSAKGSVSSGGEEKHPYFFRTVASNRQDK